MSNNEEEGKILNVRVPSSLASQIEEVSSQRGFKNKSEFVRTAIRDALNPPKELTEDTMNDLQESRAQVEEGNTTSLSDLISDTESSTTEEQSSPLAEDIVEEGSLGKLKTLFSGSERVQNGGLDVLVIGCGGKGINILNEIEDIKNRNIRTLAIDTDRQHLDVVEADTKILIGKSVCDGYGSGGDPEVAKKAVQSAEKSIKETISGMDIVFIASGFGGGTGTGAAPILAEYASETEAISIGLLTTPFNVERARQSKAQEGIEAFRSKSNTAIIFDHNLLIEHGPNLPLGKAFAVMDRIIAESVYSLVGTFSKNALVDLDFADFQTVVQDGGIGGILVGEGNINEPSEVVDETLEHPLINADVGTASRGLVQITGSEELTIADAERIVEMVYDRISADFGLIWGAQQQKNMGDQVRMMVFLTGLEYTADKVAKWTFDSESSEDMELLSAVSPSNSEQRNLTMDV